MKELLNINRQQSHLSKIQQQVKIAKLKYCSYHSHDVQRGPSQQMLFFTFTIPTYYNTFPTKANQIFQRLLWLVFLTTVCNSNRSWVRLGSNLKAFRVVNCLNYITYIQLYVTFI
ncbi:Hypothetical_protein [Hexamita inflata]|uniref:Hypothetical_protein n=1 Tax=Hexamita inflata TaxID=28002 RepID=A0AA86TUE5_9EUKA|nr:Hypothetical protein HINF_LOCUS15167 [Hexamita inflata]